MRLVVADGRVVALQCSDELTFFSANFKLVIRLEKDLLAQGEVKKVCPREIFFDQRIVPTTEIAQGVTWRSLILTHIDLSVWKSDLVDDISK